MGVKWTEEQQQVIDLRDHNILVSAAAGSGKTAVLVERIIARLTRDANPVDVDHMLIVTYTEAAAAEMKERIGAAIEKELEEDPSSEHLKRQSALIHTVPPRITTKAPKICPGAFAKDIFCYRMNIASPKLKKRYFSSTATL